MPYKVCRVEVDENGKETYLSCIQNGLEQVTYRLNRWAWRRRLNGKVHGPLAFFTRLDGARKFAQDHNGRTSLFGPERRVTRIFRCEIKNRGRWETLWCWYKSRYLGGLGKRTRWPEDGFPSRTAFCEALKLLEPVTE